MLSHSEYVYSLSATEYSCKCGTLGIFFFLVKSCGKDYLIRETIFPKNVRFDKVLQYWNYITLMI